IRGAQHDLGDLRRRREPHRRTPETRAAADVELRTVATKRPADVGRAQTDEPSEGPELTTVRVSGELEVDAALRRGGERRRIVGEQHERTIPLASRERGLE